jgi:hypothetical protein
MDRFVVPSRANIMESLRKTSAELDELKRLTPQLSSRIQQPAKDVVMVSSGASLSPPGTFLTALTRPPSMSAAKTAAAAVKLVSRDVGSHLAMNTPASAPAPASVRQQQQQQSLCPHLDQKRGGGREKKYPLNFHPL